jgi:hypothetical protein
LPVGGRNTDGLIRQFFTTYGRLRTEFQEGGMPVTAVRVLRQHCPLLNAALEHVHVLECTLEAAEHYRVHLRGGPAPPPVPGANKTAAE